MFAVDKWPKGAVYVAAVILLGLTGVGACLNYLGPIRPPSPLPAPEPQPHFRPDPSDVWRPLEVPSKNVIPGLELPPPAELSSSRKFIVVTAKCADDVHWLISSNSGKPLDVLESPLTNSIMIFPPTGVPEDTIVVLAYTVWQNKPSSTAVTFIRLKTDLPPPTPPKPDPTPEPPPVTRVNKVHVTFLLDYTKQTRAISDTVNDKDLRKWLLAQGHEVHELSIREDLEHYGLAAHVKGKQPPLLLLQAKEEGAIKEGTVLTVEPLTTPQQVKTTVLKYTGGQGGQ